ncbi:hypothetical protein G6514_003431 [Epicoccum nigrum]|nr:hypothetical protein G6514_003431 [Epicoccum nigrum]
MSRRPNNPRYSSSILPTPAGENITTREYYHPLSTDEHNDGMEFPSAPQLPKKAAVQPAERVERSPSPTPPEILLQSELQDLPVLSAVDEKMRTEGRTEAERKVRLVRLREKLEERREREREREREEARKRSR